ncbi:MAG TPA: type II secretion system protein [Nitrospira sp.]|nr:type II secretion system protein [Nitrospira sp.]
MPRTGIGRMSDERGVTYLMLMIVIVLIGIATTAAAKQWKVMVQRELEADLLSKGIEIQNALALYSATMKAGRVMQGEVYPQSLADLTRLPKPFLRKVYSDPMGHGEWEYLRAPTGGIMGVRSRSRATPFRKHDFPLEVRHFEGRASYHEWIFQYPNASSSGSIPVGTLPAQPGGTPAPAAGTSNPATGTVPNPPAETPPPSPPAPQSGGLPNSPS